MIASVIPTVGVGHTIRVMYMDVSARLAATFLANLSSIALDYVSRQTVGGTHLTVEILKQLPVLPPSAYLSSDLDFVSQRVLELTYTSYIMKPWAEDLGYSGNPFAWNEDRRALLRAELDAFFAKK